MGLVSRPGCAARRFQRFSGTCVPMIQQPAQTSEFAFGLRRRMETLHQVARALPNPPSRASTMAWERFSTSSLANMQVM